MGPRFQRARFMFFNPRTEVALSEHYNLTRILLIPFLGSKGTWEHTLGRCLLIAWQWAIVGSIGRCCRSWSPTITGLRIPWVDGLVLPKWWNRWS